MWQGPSGIMRTSTYVLQHLVHHGSSLQRLALASSTINPSIDPQTTILCRFKTTRMTKSHWFARFLSCSNISINCLSFHVQFMSFSFRFVSFVEQIPKSKNNKRNKVVLLQNLYLRKDLIKASSQFGKKVPHRSPKTWQVVSEGVIIINKLFQLWGGSRAYFPFISIRFLSCPFIPFQFRSCPLHFLVTSFSCPFMSFSVGRFPKSKNYTSFLLTPLIGKSFKSIKPQVNWAMGWPIGAQKTDS